MWLGQVCTSMGQWMDQVARGYLIYQITGSALKLGIATAMRGLPLLFFGIIAGAVADRYGRKAQLVIAQVTNGLLNITLASLVLTHRVQPWHVYVTGFLAGTVQAFQQPARQALISDMVGNRYLMNALALNSVALNGSRTIGPAIAGLLIALVGVDGSYFAQAALYLFATVWTIQMVVPPPRDTGQRRARQSFVSDIKGGLGYVATDPNIRILMLLALVPITLAMPYTSLMPVFARDVLHGGAGIQGLLLTCVGLGALGGALVVASMRRSNGYGWTVAAGAAVFGAFLMAFSESRWVAVSALLAAAVGVFSVVYQTQNQTLLQVLAPRNMRGRVMSIYLLNRGLVPLGSLLAGALASAYGGPRALLIMSGASVGVVTLLMLMSPGFVHLRVPLEGEAQGHV